MEKEKQLIQRHYVNFNHMENIPTAYCFPSDVEKLEKEIAELKAEIERKDEALRICNECTCEFKSGDVGTALLATRIQRVSKQALQGEEE
jgi:hypothetical protein